MYFVLNGKASKFSFSLVFPVYNFTMKPDIDELSVVW